MLLNIVMAAAKLKVVHICCFELHLAPFYRPRFLTLSLSCDVNYLPYSIGMAWLAA